MKHVFAISAMTALLLAGGCREQVSGDHVKLTGKIFVFNYRIAEAAYVVTLGKTRPIEEGAIAIASFENPAGGDPLVVRQKIWPQAEKIVLESPPLSCVRKGRPYRIAILIEDVRGTNLQSIETTLTSTLDQDVLPDKPLVTGPAYEPNPELAGNPGGKMGEPDKCPV